MNFIKRMLWRCNAKRVVAAWFSDYEWSKEWSKTKEIYRQISDWESALNAALPRFDGYVEYTGRPVKNSWVTEYDFTDARNTAEILMYQRLSMQSGKGDSEFFAFNIETIEVPYPYNTAMTRALMANGHMAQIPKRRLYYRIKSPDEPANNVSMDRGK